MAIHIVEDYVSVEAYAKLCRISRRSVMNRIQARSIHAVEVDGYYAVNIRLSPPKKFIHGTEPHKGGAFRLYPDLKLVTGWCHAKGIRAEKSLRAIITGSIDGWVIGGEVFARGTDLETLK